MLGRFVFSCFGLFPISCCWRNTKRCNQWVFPLQRRWGQWLGRCLSRSRKNQRWLSPRSLLQENTASLLWVEKPLVNWVNFSFLVSPKIWNWRVRPQHLWDWLFKNKKFFKGLYWNFNLYYHFMCMTISIARSPVSDLLFGIWCRLLQRFFSHLTVCSLLSKRSL